MADNRLLGTGGMYYNNNEIGKAYLGSGLIWEKAGFTPSFQFEAIKYNNQYNILNSTNGQVSSTTGQVYKAPVHTSGNNYDELSYSYSTNYGSGVGYLSYNKVTIAGVKNLKITLNQNKYYQNTWNYIYPYIVISNHLFHESKTFTSGTRIITTYIAMTDGGKIIRGESLTYNSRYGSWNTNTNYYYAMAWNGAAASSNNKFWGFQNFDYTPSSSEAPSLLTSGTTENQTVSYTYTLQPDQTYVLSVGTLFYYSFSAAGGLTQTATCSAKFEYL